MIFLVLFVHTLCSQEGWAKRGIVYVSTKKGNDLNLVVKEILHNVGKLGTKVIW